MRSILNSMTVQFPSPIGQVQNKILAQKLRLNMKKHQQLPPKSDGSLIIHKNIATYSLDEFSMKNANSFNLLSGKIGFKRNDHQSNTHLYRVTSTTGRLSPTTVYCTHALTNNYTTHSNTRTHTQTQTRFLRSSQSTHEYTKKQTKTKTYQK